MERANERMHVVVTCHNASRFIEKSITSIRHQTWQSLSVMVVVDASTDGSAERAQEAIGEDSRFRLHVLEQRVWAANARKIALDRLDARSEEIVVLVDGDDWLLSAETLAIIHQFHHSRRLLVAYGNYITTDDTVGAWGRDYPLAAKITGTHRSIGWLCAPPRSFRYGLWSHVQPGALKDSSGEYFRVATDIALFLPILELAGMRSGFLKQPLYVYNRETPFNNDKIEPQVQRQTALEILHRPPYAALPGEVQRSLL
jgi:glycosyltransferase involved in cell wall biosynthesis